MLDEDKIKKYALNCYLRIRGYTLEKAADKFRMSFPKILYQYALIIASEKKKTDDRNTLLFSFQYARLKNEYFKLEADRISIFLKQIDWLLGDYASAVESGRETDELFRIKALNFYKEIYNSSIPLVNNVAETLMLCDAYGDYNLTKSYKKSLDAMIDLIDVAKQQIKYYSKGV